MKNKEIQDWKLVSESDYPSLVKQYRVQRRSSAIWRWTGFAVGIIVLMTFSGTFLSIVGLSLLLAWFYLKASKEKVLSMRIAVMESIIEGSTDQYYE